MQTECPHCNTVFQIQQAELEQADQQVRCGHCLAIFTADIFNESENIDEDNASIETQHSVADVIPPELRAESRTQKTHYGFLSSLFLTVFILAGIATLFLQYAYYNRDTLVKITELRPYLTIMCQQINCTLPAPKDTQLIALTSKNIFSHPNADNALMVSASIINQASFAQDYPTIELRFENIRGKTIAARRFTADEYLNIPADQIAKMQPDISISINLEIIDPGNDMVSYEFSFL